MYARNPSLSVYIYMTYIYIYTYNVSPNGHMSGPWSAMGPCPAHEAHTNQEARHVNLRKRIANIIMFASMLEPKLHSYATDIPRKLPMKHPTTAWQT